MAGNAGSLQGAAQKFDLNSQEGVMAVLKAVRHSSLPLAEQNELRDLIFLYTNGGGDPDTKKQLEEKLASVDLTPAPPKAEEAPAAEGSTEATRPAPQQPGVGQSRPTPRFSQPATPPPAPQPTEPAPATTSSAPPEQPAPAPQPAPEPQPAPTPPPQPESTPQRTPPPPQPKPEPQAAPAPQPPATAPAGGESGHLTRVRQIKLEVNKLVGNPVNLVDINNEVGREYMTALLEAMKKLHGGQPVEVEQAMDRLEKAFVAVKEAVAQAPAGAVKPTTEKQAAAVPESPAASTPPPPPQPAPEPKSAPTPPPQPEPTPQQASPRPTPASPTPAEPPKPPTPPTPPQQPAPQPRPGTASGDQAPSPADFKQPGSLRSLADEVRLKRSGGEAGGAGAGKATAGAKTPETPQPATPPASSAPSAPDQSAAPKPPPQSPTAAEPPKQSSGLAARIAALTGGDQPTGDSASAAPSQASTPPPAAPPAPPDAAAKTPTPPPAAPAPESPKAKEATSERAMDPNDPLMAPEITSGLDQLLSEWNLFKSSGLFGTGPNGREHPLFQKLKNLSITNILAGRYDGAKPEVKQSITDYMNGWRYEQGVVYEPGETFEHYLRRVIKHILDSKTQ